MGVLVRPLQSSRHDPVHVRLRPPVDAVREQRAVSLHGGDPRLRDRAVDPAGGAGGRARETRGARRRSRAGPCRRRAVHRQVLGDLRDGGRHRVVCVARLAVAHEQRGVPFSGHAHRERGTAPFFDVTPGPIDGPADCRHDGGRGADRGAQRSEPAAWRLGEYCPGDAGARLAVGLHRPRARAAGADGCRSQCAPDVRLHASGSRHHAEPVLAEPCRPARRRAARRAGGARARTQRGRRSSPARCLE